MFTKPRSMKLNLKALVIVLLSATSQVTIAQDIHFSQFYTSPVLLNPAAAGTADRGLRGVLNYKNQWRSVSSASAYNTAALAVDKAFLKDKSLGGGLSFYNDRAGDSKIQTNQANLIIAANKNVNPSNNLSLGIQGGFVQKSINYAALTWDNQYNGSTFDKGLPSGETGQKTSITYLDLAAGFQWKLKIGKQLRFNTGVSMWHLTNPKNSFNGINSEKLSPRLSIYENAYIELKGSDIAILPSILFQTQGTTRELLIGSLLRFSVGQESHFTGVKTSSAFYVGAHMRAKDSFIAVVMFDLKHWVTMGLSYDITVSKLTVANSSRGGMEISLGIPVDGHHYAKATSVKFQ
jgi:type IX secretion system PorP/SprF family membrane protein